jgi:hypothetical protein
MFFATGAPGALVAEFERAGLGDLDETRQHEILHFEDAEAVIGAVLLGGPVALAVNRFGDDIWREVCAEFLASVADHRMPDGTYEIPGEFVTVAGTAG